MTSTSSMLSMPPSRTPARMAPCTAAPYATASSGCTLLHSCLPSKNSCRMACTRGTRVEPPTSTISSTSSLDCFESVSTRLTHSRQRWKVFSHNLSNLARVTSHEISWSPTVISTRALVELDSWRLAVSHAERSLRVAPGESVNGSSPVRLRWSCATQSAMAESKSSPPRWVSPEVAITENTPSSMDSSDTSKVPPPRSKTSTFCETPLALSRPYASAAAVGSLMTRSTSRPAMVPASLVRRRCASLKYAGTVTTALEILVSSATSAAFFIFSSTMALTCSGMSSRFFAFSPSPEVTQMTGLPALPSLISKGMRRVSSWHSLNCLPMMRLMLKRVRDVLRAAWFLAPSPTRRSPAVSVNATHEGVVRAPRSFARTSGSPLRHTATHEKVVPRSMPITCSVGAAVSAAAAPSAIFAAAAWAAMASMRALSARHSARPDVSDSFSGSCARPVWYAVIAPMWSPERKSARPRRP
mmetsp:Transcript_11652/g.49029  ORF Transcript_11652/g.49029 Transcript_11652/m.49029 type:complete len:471 (+) Transcript_11652:469-1881(+)